MIHRPDSGNAELPDWSAACALLFLPRPASSKWRRLLVQIKAIGGDSSLKVVNANLRFQSEENIISCLSDVPACHCQVRWARIFPRHAWESMPH
jgi:hypothetical protein